MGAAGGLGGFFLPSVLGATKDVTGTYGFGLLLFGAAFLFGALVLLELGARWNAGWQPHAVKQAGMFCYRSVARGSEETA